MPKTDTRRRLQQHIAKNHPIRVKMLVDHFGLSPQIIHRHLKKLLDEKTIIKKGKMPDVTYAPAQPSMLSVQSLTDRGNILQENWLTVLPDGTPLKGKEGFIWWCEERGFEPQKKYVEYEATLKKYDRYRKNGYIDATEKFRDLFPEPALAKVLYLDFYSYEIFGRTRWGSMLLYAKLNEDKALMDEVFRWAKPKIQTIIHDFQIDSVGFIPHSLKRKTPFLPNLKKYLNLPLPNLPLVKISGEITLAQKTLKNSAERIANAEQTIFVEPGKIPTGQRLLLIDDAVGSGATLQKTAEKCRRLGVAHVYGLALVGSIKGFEVIAEI